MALSGNVLSASDILDQLWASRERDLLQRIAADNSELDYDTLLSTYGNKSAKLGVKLEVNVGGFEEAEPKKKKSRRSSVPESERCMARVWNGGKGGRCTRRGCKGSNGDLCGNHARCLEEKGELPQGRIDEDLPENMISSADNTPKSDAGVVDLIQEGGIGEFELDAALNQMVAEDPFEVVDDVPGELSSSPAKKKRGRPKGRKNSKPEEDQSLEEEGEILEEEEMKSCVSQSDIQECLTDYLSGADWDVVTLTSAKKAIEKKLSIKSSDYDKKWFKGVFDSKKSEMEAKIAESKKEAEEKEDVEDVNVEEEDDGNDSDSEEVACQEITVGDVVYLLDPESMKVYARESPNGFVGKYDGTKIDHDAEDSDAESDDEE